MDLGTLRFKIEISARYHERRQSTLEFRHGTTQVLTVILGSAAAVAFFGTDGKSSDNTLYSGVPALVLTILTAIDLVSRTAQKAGEHARLRQKFLLLRAKCIGEISAQAVEDLKGKMALIDAEEPPVYPTVALEARNDAARPRDAMVYELSLWRALLGRLFRIGVPKELKQKSAYHLPVNSQNP